MRTFANHPFRLLASILVLLVIALILGFYLSGLAVPTTNVQSTTNEANTEEALTTDEKRNLDSLYITCGRPHNLPFRQCHRCCQWHSQLISPRCLLSS